MAGGGRDGRLACGSRFGLAVIIHLYQLYPHLAGQLPVLMEEDA